MTESDLFGAGMEAVLLNRSATQAAAAADATEVALEAQRSCSWLLHIHIFAALMSAAVIRPGNDLEQTSASLRQALLDAGKKASTEIDSHFGEALVWPETAYLGVLKRLASGLAESWKQQGEVPAMELGELAARALCIGLRGGATNGQAKGTWLVGLELVSAAFRLHHLARVEDAEKRLVATLRLVQGAYEGAVRLLHTHLPLPPARTHGDLIVIGFIQVAVSVMVDVGITLPQDQVAGSPGNSRMDRILELCDARLRLLGSMGAEETDDLMRTQWSDEAVNRLKMSLVTSRWTLQTDLANPFGRITTETRAAA